MAEGEVQKNEVQRWTAKRRAALVLQILKGKTRVAEAARTHGLTVAEGGTLEGKLPRRGRKRLEEPEQERRSTEGSINSETRAKSRAHGP